MAVCRTYRGPEKGRTPKRRFTTRAEAEEAIERLYEARPHEITAVQPYECPKCDFWHFGKLSARKADPHIQELRREKHLEALVGKLIGVIRGTYPSPPRTRKRPRK